MTTSASTINYLYQKYFARPASQAELTFWATQPSTTLETQLATDYTKSSGIAFDGSPVSPGQNKTNTQLEQIGRDQGLAAMSKVAAPANQPTSPSSPATPTTSDIHPADSKWINDLYQKYYDRTATSSELSTWAKDTPVNLEKFLNDQSSGTGTYGNNGLYKYESTWRKSQTDSKTNAALDLWHTQAKAAGFPQSIIDLGDGAIKAYQGDKFEVAKVVEAFNVQKAKTIDPYYKELADVAIKDFQTNNQNLMTDRGRELEAERANAGDSVRQAIAGNEKAGMTFTGKSIQDLGANSAYAQNANQGVATPAQTPFGGMFYEGTVNQGNRLIASSTAARYAQAQQALGRKAEDYLGTSGAAGLGIAYNPAGVNQTGTIASDQQKAYGSAMDKIINQSRTGDQFNNITN